MNLTSILEKNKSGLIDLIKNKLELDAKDVDRTIDSTKMAISDTFMDKAQDFGKDTLLNLFSSNKNTKSSDNLLKGFGGNLLERLLSKGFDKKTAATIKGVVLPFVMSLFSKHINGKEHKLKDLLGDVGGSFLKDLF